MLKNLFNLLNLWFLLPTAKWKVNSEKWKIKVTFWAKKKGSTPVNYELWIMNYELIKVRVIRFNSLLKNLFNLFNLWFLSPSAKWKVKSEKWKIRVTLIRLNVTQKAQKAQNFYFLKSRRNKRNHRTEVDGPKGKVKIDFIMKSQSV